jgi:hypothetical protein
VCSTIYFRASKKSDRDHRQAERSSAVSREWQWPRRHRDLKLRDSICYAAPDSCAGGIAGRREFIDEDDAFGLSLVAVAHERWVRGGIPGRGSPP